MNELALFAGAGGGILGGHLLGWRTVCAVEWEPYAASVLCARQNDGILPPFPIWSDVRTFDGRPWRGRVDVISGGFPCQDISAAGKGGGIDGERSGLWREMARIVGEVLPRFVFVENSPLLVGRGAAMVIGDLAALGYDCRWACVAASDVGAPHQRDRFWLVADAGSGRCMQSCHGEMEQSRRTEVVGAGVMADTNSLWESQQGRIDAEIRRWACNGSDETHMANGNGNGIQRMVAESQPGRYRRQAGLHSGARELPVWPDDPADAAQPAMGRVANGVAARVDRLKAIGNGQVPRVAATAWRILTA
jgi:DNA (cytosine-5)-methyltransferase 1